MVKALQVDLGTLDPPVYATGWYRDPNTGQYYYYDASARQWYIYAAGYLYPLTITEYLAPKTVNIAPGDTLRIEYRYKYAGPAVSVTEYASIGVKGITYDEKTHSSKSRSLPESTTPATYTGSIDIVLPTSAGPSWDDIECKVYNGGKELGLRYIGALNVIAVEAEFTEFAITEYSKV